MGATDVEVVVTVGLVAFDRRQSRNFANFANRLESFRWNKSHPFSVVQQFRVAKLYLLSP
jgi:hypothetical protein